MKQRPVFSVGELTQYVKNRLEIDPTLQSLQVQGEISNLTYHGSGHVYFSLKDTAAQLSCVMFRGYAQFAPKVQKGDKVVLTGNMTVYAPRGNYQLMVTALKKAGLGDLHQQFLERKDRLQREGLFDPADKAPIPTFPQHIVLITSPTGAAVKDMIRTIQRRYNRGKLTLIPTIVQGVGGEASILRSLALAQETDADVILLGRGGGSLEDLWNFNEESVARAIYESEIPIITGIGHETDFTIADFVADLRASTPTAAAERAVPDLASLLYTLEEYETQLKRNLQYFIDFKRQVLDDYTHRLEQQLRRYLQEKKHALNILETQLKGLDITKLLEQGYTLTIVNGQIQTSSKGLSPGTEMQTVFKDGKVQSRTE